MLNDELLKQLAKQLGDKIKGEKGKDGKDGITPTEKQLISLIVSVLAKFKKEFIIKGDKGDKGDSIKGKDGRDGRKPIKGIDFFDGEDGKDGRTLKHEVKDSKLRFENPDGTWGTWVDFEAIISPIADRFAKIIRSQAIPSRRRLPFTPVGTRIASQSEVDAGTEDNKIVTPETLASYSPIVANTAKNSYPSADENKLAGIEDNATADQTGAEIKTAIGQQIILKTADETVNNSSTLQDDDHLILPVLANEIWQIEIGLLYNSSIGADFKWGWSVPSGTQVDIWAVASSNDRDETDVMIRNGSGLDRMDISSGVVRALSTAGNVIIKWAQNNAEVSDTKLIKGSYIIATKLN